MPQTGSAQAVETAAQQQTDAAIAEGAPNPPSSATDEIRTSPAATPVAAAPAPEEEAAARDVPGDAMPDTPSPVASPLAARRQPSAADAHSLAMTLEDTPEAQGGRGFVWGFALVSLVALAGVAVYARHTDLAAALPQLSDPLAQYVETVNRGREVLAETVNQWLPEQ